MNRLKNENLDKAEDWRYKNESNLMPNIGIKRRIDLRSAERTSSVSSNETNSN
jgi:hypothetical protein